MTVYRLSFRESYTSNRDCMIVIQPQRAAYQALCVDAATRLTIGCPPIPRCADGSRPAISATDIMGMIGEYRLASIAVDKRTSWRSAAGGYPLVCGRAGEDGGLAASLRKGEQIEESPLRQPPPSDDGSGTISA
jgi:hypothetical protein